MSMSKTNHTREQIGSLLTFLEPINAYDREEVVSEICANIDIHNRVSIRQLLDKQYFLDQWYITTSTPIKCNLASILLSVMKDSSFDFEWLTQDADGTFLLPHSIGTGHARVIYQEIYRATYDHWRDELGKSGPNLPHPEELGIPPVK